MRQLDHLQVIRPCGDVAGGKGSPPAANGFVIVGQRRDCPVIADGRAVAFFGRVKRALWLMEGAAFVSPGAPTALKPVHSKGGTCRQKATVAT